jgi:hypothetical protein
MPRSQPRSTDETGHHRWKRRNDVEGDMVKRVVIGVVAGLIALGASGCGRDNFRDVEGVPSQNPDKIELYNNVDKHPNIVMVCIHGVAFVTTTRDYNSIMRVADLDKQCPAG